MPYEKQTFVDHETKLSAAHLQYIEDGIVEAFDEIQQALERVKTVNGIAPDENGNVTVEATGSGVYIGSGDVPDGYNVQIDPTGEAIEPDDLITKEYMQTQVLPNLLPTVTEADNGKFLCVASGSWAAVTMANAEEVGF